MDSISEDNKVIYEFLVEYIFLRPYKLFAQQFLFSPKFSHLLYDCHVNTQKAQKIVDQWLQNWYTAFTLAKSIGFEATFILQPTLYSSATTPGELIDHPKYSEVVQLQVDLMYDLFKSKVNAECSVGSDFCDSVHFGDKWLVGNSHVFFDDHHITPEGNAKVASKILAIEGK